MRLCPYCEQDAVWKVELVSDPACQFSMCFECDSVWRPDQPVSELQGSTFSTYMELLDRTPDWSNIRKLEMVEKGASEP
jgi:hypothetical protein